MTNDTLIARLEGILRKKSERRTAGDYTEADFAAAMALDDMVDALAELKAMDVSNDQ